MSSKTEGLSAGGASEIRIVQTLDSKSYKWSFSRNRHVETVLKKGFKHTISMIRAIILICNELNSS